MRFNIRRLRSGAARSAAVGVTALAVLLPAGLAAAATTQHAAARQLPAATFTWHKLTLINGWTSLRSSTYHVADPAWAISGGVVYLTGVLYQPASGSREFAVLPKAAWPTHVLYREVVVSGDTAGDVVIGTSGTMLAFSRTANAAELATTLTGVSYPAPGTTWHNLTLINGWKAYPSQIAGNETPAYAIKGGVVYLNGALRQPAGTKATFAVLPKAARPAREMILSVVTDATNGSVTILPNGDMVADGTPQANVRAYASLGALSYPAAGATWHNLALVNGWISAAYSLLPTGSPAYTVIGGVVYLSGSMFENTGNSDLFASLPAAARPVHIQYDPVYTVGGNFGAGRIIPGQGMFADSQPLSNAQGFTSLAGISSPLSS